MRSLPEALIKSHLKVSILCLLLWHFIGAVPNGLAHLIAVRPEAVFPENREKRTGRVLSKNGQHAAEVIQNGSEQEVVVTKVPGGEVLWRETLPENDYSRITPPECQVSNDGTVAVLTMEMGEHNSRELHFFASNGKRKSLVLAEFGFVSDASRSLELIVEEGGQEVFGGWYDGEWMAISLKNFERVPAGAPSVSMLAQALESKAVRKIEEYMQANQQRSEGEKPLLDNELISSFRFVAARQNSQTERWAHLLMEWPLNRRIEQFGIARGNRIIHEAFSPHRALGDELMGTLKRRGLIQWNASTDLRRFHFLGGVSGLVHLPFKAPANAGDVTVSLFQERKEADVAEKEEMTKLVFTLRSEWPPENGNDRMEFYFGTLTPGQYRMRAFWDRRPGDDQTAPAEGDYVSAESEMLTIGPGTVLSNVVLQCTKTVGAWSGYAEDAAWAQEFPARTYNLGEEDKQLEQWAAQSDTFLRAGKDFELRRGRDSAGVVLSELRIMNGGEVEHLGLPILGVKIRKAADRSGDLEDYRAEIKDPHGCRYESREFWLVSPRCAGA